MNSTVNIEGKEYILDVSRAVELGVLKNKEIINVKVGSYIEIDGEIYIFAIVNYQSGFYVNLIDIRSGKRFTNPLKIKNHNEVTEAEWAELTAGLDYKVVNLNIEKVLTA